MRPPRERLESAYHALPIPLHSKQLLINWGVIAFGLLSLYGFTAISLIIVARSVSKFEYGQYLAVFSLATLTVVAPSFGMDSWLLTQGRAIAGYGRNFWLRCLRLRTGSLAIWLLALAALTLVLPQATFPADLMLVTVIGVAFESITAMAYSFMRGADKHTQVTLLQAASATLLLVVTLLLPLEPGRILWFAAGRTVLAALVFVVVSYGLYRGQRQIERYPLGDRVVLAESGPFLVTDLSAVVYGKVDITLLSLLAGASATSVYGPAVNLLMITFIPARSLYFFAVPRLTQARERSQRLFRRQSINQFWTQAAGGSLLSVLLLVSAPLLTTLVYGTAYLDSVPVLQVLSVITLLRAINFALAAPLIAGGDQAKRARVQVVAALFNIVLNLAIIPSWGVMGVAIVYVLTELLLATGYAVLTRQLLSVRDEGEAV